jgi:hypothetical protein
MKSVVVTLISNVILKEDNLILDEQGQAVLCRENFAVDEEGAPYLVDEDDVGMLLKTHAVQVSQLNQQTNVLEVAALFRAEVVWNKRRSPCPAFEDPSSLVFISIDEDEGFGEDGDEDEDDEDQFQELS